MRWLAFFILAYLMLGAQLGLGSFIQYRSTSPDLVLLVVVFISLNAPREEAMLGSFLLGAMQDLVTLQPMGLYAFSYGLVAMMICSMAQLAYREHPLTQFSMTLFGGLVTGIVLLIQGWIHRKSEGAPHVSPRMILVMAGYTAVLSPVVLGILQRMHRVFGFQASARRRARA